MDALLETILEAHGGLTRWQSFARVDAHLIQGGALWGLKGKAGLLDDTTVTVELRTGRASHHPFGDPRRLSVFVPDRVAILGSDGALIESLTDPRASFAGHSLETPWTDPQLAYFAGYAMWTYLNTPFLMARPGVEAWEIEPWREKGETWRRLRVRFPADIATHSAEQTLHVGEDGLLRRHDYDVAITGGTPGAHYISDYIDVSGIKFPTRRRIFPRTPEGQSLAEPLVVSIDLDNIVLS
ncbi:MAG: hypothetical protein J0I45_22400 [Bosea sp.]|nr:hypothetical protein [Bosea sp. (in: a-proteobacteria)]